MYLDINLTNLTKGVLCELTTTRELLLPLAQIELTHILHISLITPRRFHLSTKAWCVSVRISVAQWDCASC